MAGFLISVIIPSYGMGRFVARALESIGAQAYSEWEVLLVDDCGPEDGTRGEVETVGRFVERPEIPNASDWDFFLRCVSAGMRFAFLREENVFYRKHAGSATSNYLQMTKSCVKVLRKNALVARGNMERRLRNSLHKHLVRLVYLKASFRDWSLVRDLGEAVLGKPFVADVWLALHKGFRNNWWRDCPRA